MAKQDFIEEATPAFGGGTYSGPVSQEPVAPEPDTPAPVASQTVSIRREPVVVDSTANDVSWEEEKTILLFEEDNQDTEFWMEGADGKRIDIEHFPFTIGRDPQADICLRDSGVSRRHARIVKTDEGELVIEDLGSVNGISVNSHKTQKVVLGDEDSIVIGDKRFCYTLHLTTNEVTGKSADSVVSAGTATLAKAGQSLAAKGRQMLELVQHKVDKLKSTKFSSKDSALTTAVPATAASGQDRTVQQKIRRLATVFVPVIAIMVGYYFYSLNNRVVRVPPPASQVTADSSQRQDRAPQDDKTSSLATAAGENMPQKGVDTNATPTGTAQASVDGSPSKVVEAVPQRDSSAKSENAESSTLAAADTSQQPSGENNSSKDRQSIEEAKALTAGASNSANDASNLVTSVERPEVNEVASADSSDQTLAAPKRIRRSSAWSRGYIQNSLNKYVSGEADEAINRLMILSRSSRHQQQFRDQAASHASRLSAMYQQYQRGQSLSSQGQRDAAFVEWQGFLLAESEMFPGGVSTYARQIEAEVVTEYQSAGDQASSEGRYHDAYQAWQKAASIEPTGAAARSLSDLKARAKQAYISGYQQESVNIQVATGHWNDVLALVPSGYEYHTKAKAKLKLYRNYGSQ